MNYKVNCLLIFGGSVLSVCSVLVFLFVFKEYDSGIQIWTNHLRLTRVERTEAKEGNNGITRIIHQSWKTNYTIPKVFQRYIPSWSKCFPDWQYILWTDKDNRNLIATHYPWFLAKYDSFSHGIYRADCARYVYMYHYGGIYTDMDNECLRPFEHLLVNYTIVFGDIDHVPKVTRLQDANYVQNSFMYSKPKQTFWLDLLHDILESDNHATADIVTGPLVLSNLIERFRNRNSSSHGIKIYGAKYFNPITWGRQKLNYQHCKIYNQMSQTEYLKCRENYKNQGSYVLQYHSHVWG